MSKKSTKGKSKGGKIPPVCKKTGGKVDDVVLRLLKHGDDADTDVKNEIFQSLTLIGKKQPLFVCTQSIDYLSSSNVSTAHRARILQLASSIIEEETSGDNRDILLEEELPLNIIKFATSQMQLKNQPSVQNQAVKLLVALSYQNCSDVVESILAYFRTGSIPSYYVLKSLSDTAKSNPIQFVDKLGDIFSKVTPVLGLVKKDDEIQIFTLALGRFAEAILKYQEEREERLLRKKDQSNNDNDDDDKNNPFAADMSSDNDKKSNKKDDDEMKEVFTEFATNCAASFDVVFTNWRKVKSMSIRLAVAEALGLLTEVMSKKKFQARFIEVLMYFAGALKAAQSNPKHQPALTRGMCSVLKVMNRDELADGKIDDIEKHLNLAMDVLHPLASRNPDYADQKQVRNHTNILMSFEYMARSRLTQTLTYLLSKFQVKASPKYQLASLLILKHIINSMDDRLDSSKSLILSSCLQLMEVSNIEVRKAFIQLIMAMADQNYLNLEGGTNLISFLVKMCSLKLNDDKNKQIKSGADHILHVIASKVQSSHQVLWPYLFELIVPNKNMLAIGSISRVLSLIARHKKSNNDDKLNVKWHKDVNLPHPGEILIKLFILLHRPYMTKNYGEYICALLYNIGGILNDELNDLFIDNFKLVGKFIKDNVNNPHDKVLDNKISVMLIKLYRTTCDKLEADDTFITEMGNALVKQFNHYQSDIYLQKITLIFLGQTAAFSSKKAWLTKQLKKMIELTNVKSIPHQDGCSLGYGLCSVTHLDTVLLRTTELMADSEKTKKGGLFGLGGKKKLPGSNEKKCLCVRSWGWITKKCPANLVTSRLDAHVFIHLLKVMNLADNDMLKYSVINCVEMISESMNNAYKTTNYKVKKRDDFIKGMLKYIKTTKHEKMKKLAMTTISSLLYLKPPIDVGNDLRNQIIEITLKHLNNCKLSDDGNDDDDDHDEKKDTTTTTTTGSPSPTPTADDDSLLQCMQTILIALLETQPKVESVCQLIFKLEFWVVSKKINERICALETYKLLTKRFIGILRKGNDLKDTKAKEKEKSLKNLGHYLATIIPRVTDNNLKVRGLAMDTIQMLLFIDQLLRNPGNEKPSDELRSLNSLKKELYKEKVPEHRLQKVYYLSEILCKLASAQEMQTLLINLIRGVNDDDRQSALGTCKALQGILRERALETKQYVEKLLDINLVELKKFIDNDKKKNVMKQQLISICILTREHFDDILELMHKKSFPLDKASILVFKALAADPKLKKKVIDYELNVINTSPININGLTKNVCIATKALQTFFTLDETKPIIQSSEYYYQFLSTLCTRLGTAICKRAKKSLSVTKKADTVKSKKSKKNLKKAKKSKKADKKTSKNKNKNQNDDDDHKSGEPVISAGVSTAVKDTILGIRWFLTAADEKLLLTNMEEDNTWKKFELQKNYEIGLAEFINKWAKSRIDSNNDKKKLIEKKNKLFQSMIVYFKKHFLGHRLSAAVIVAELIRHTGNDKKFLDNLVKEMLPRISDSEPRVRRQGLVGLGNLSDVWNDELVSKAPAILSSLTSAIEDKEEIVCISAIRSLILVLLVVDNNTVQPSLINICFRTRPFLDSENADIRVEAFKLFGKLCKFGLNNYNFVEQIHKNMACFMCHINDVNDNVSREVYNTCLIVFKYLSDDKILTVLSPQDNFEDSCDDIIGKGNFISLLVKIIPIMTDVNDRKYYDYLTLYLQSTINYMNSSRWGEIRGNAALFSAKIIQCVDKQFASTHLDCNAVIDVVLKLLQSKSARVRRRTAKSLSYLSNA